MSDWAQNDAIIDDFGHIISHKFMRYKNPLKTTPSPHICQMGMILVQKHLILQPIFIQTHTCGVVCEIVLYFRAPLPLFANWHPKTHKNGTKMATFSHPSPPYLGWGCDLRCVWGWGENTIIHQKYTFIKHPYTPHICKLIGNLMIIEHHNNCYNCWKYMLMMMVDDGVWWWWWVLMMVITVGDDGHK